MANIALKSLIGLQDFDLGFGTESQPRGTSSVPVTKLMMDFIFDDLADIKALDVTKVKFSTLVTGFETTSYVYDVDSVAVPDDVSVILPNSGIGRWILRTIEVTATNIETITIIAETIETVSIISEIIETLTITAEEIGSLEIIVDGKSFAKFFRGEVVTVPIIGGVATIDWLEGTTFNIDVDQNFGVDFINIPAIIEGECQVIWITFRNAGAFSITGGLNPELGFTVYKPDSSSLLLTPGPGGIDVFTCSIQGTSELFVFPAKNMVTIV